VVALVFFNYKESHCACVLHFLKSTLSFDFSNITCHQYNVLFLLNLRIVLVSVDGLILSRIIISAYLIKIIVIGSWMFDGVFLSKYLYSMPYSGG